MIGPRGCEASRTTENRSDKDVTETKNLAKDCPDITKRLAKMREGRGSQVREQ